VKNTNIQVKKVEHKTRLFIALLTHSVHDNAGDDDHDEGQDLGHCEDVLDPSCPFHIRAVHKC